jgi:ABC-type spermidine/putrescine transport system permease subunit II
MTVRRLLSVVLLALLAVLQFVILAVPAALLVAGQSSSWALLGRDMTEGMAPLACLVAIAASVLLGVPAALALWRRQGWGLVAGVLLAPLLLPATWLGQIGANAELMLVGHASLGVAIGTACALAGLRLVEPGLLRAAASCGVSPFAAYRRVVLRLLVPGILAGVLLAGASSVAASLMALAPSRPAPLAALMGLGLSPALAVVAVAVALWAVTVAALTLLRRS